MTTANPYAAPTTDLAQNESTYKPEVFTFLGRIGRLRYLAYGMAWNFTIGFVGMLLVGILSLVEAGLAVGVLLVYAAMIVPTFAMAVRRLNDLNMTGWLSPLMLVPLVNVVFGLVLVFVPGTQGPNDYGPAPGPNSGLVVVAALILPIIAVIGIVAAVALPAYQEYVERAQAAQMQQLQ